MSRSAERCGVDEERAAARVGKTLLAVACTAGRAVKLLGSDKLGSAEQQQADRRGYR